MIRLSDTLEWIKADLDKAYDAGFAEAQEELYED